MTPKLIPNFPGLHEAWTPERPYFERAYSLGDTGVMRMRFEPIAADPGMDANIPLQPRHIGGMGSASLVDDAGAVVMIRGRGVVRPAMSFNQAVNDLSFTEEAFLQQVANHLANDLVSFVVQLNNMSLLIPPPVAPAEPEPEPA